MKAELEAYPNAEVDAEIDVEAEAQAEVEADTEAKTQRDRGADAEAEAEAGVRAQTEAWPVIEMEAMPASESVAEPEPPFLPLPWSLQESALRHQTRCIRCLPDGEGYAVSSVEGRVALEWFDMDPVVCGQAWGPAPVQGAWGLGGGGAGAYIHGHAHSLGPAPLDRPRTACE